MFVGIHIFLICNDVPGNCNRTLFLMELYNLSLTVRRIFQFSRRKLLEYVGQKNQKIFQF